MHGIFSSSIHFVIGPISFKEIYFNILDRYILVKRPLEKIHFNPQWSHNTNDDPNKTGAMRRAMQPPLSKNNLETIKSFLIFDLYKYRTL